MKQLIVILIMLLPATSLATTDIITNLGSYHITDYPFVEDERIVVDDVTFTSSMIINEGSGTIQLGEVKGDVQVGNQADRWNDITFTSMAEEGTSTGASYTTTSFGSRGMLQDRGSEMNETRSIGKGLNDTNRTTHSGFNFSYTNTRK
jgi:hypothetical protein